MKIFEDAKDKNVSKTLVFFDREHMGHIYYDKECTKEVPNEDIPDLFIKGMLVAPVFEGEVYQYMVPVEIYKNEETNKWEVIVPQTIPDPIN